VAVRTGQYPGEEDRDVFRRRFLALFDDPAFDRHGEALRALEEEAWQAYHASRKAPRTTPAGPEFADPTYEISVEWLATRAKVQAAAARQADPESPSRVLLVCGAGRNDGTCPGEVSKTHRMVELAREGIVEEDPDIEVDVLDLSWLASQPHLKIHPCKACASTAMPLCHWPCSCYPNHALGQVDDWMAEIYERLTAAHGVLFVTPVYWYQVPGGLKAMIDRLVCADGGNPDPTTTHGKDPEAAKKLELSGWGYPKHLAGRAFALVVHGDVEGVDHVRTALSDWLTWMGLVSAGVHGEIGRYVGYWKPYATSHDWFDEDKGLQDEVRLTGRSLALAVHRVREKKLTPADVVLESPRRK
jgi:multimeric flavodoxin WrbA